MGNSNIKSDPKSVKLEDIGSSLFNPATEETLKSIAGFELPPYDTLELTYVTSGNGIGEIETVLYKKDSVLVATLTLGYDSNDNLISVVKS
jgi:hypothetical protein